jgi:Tfp pilus assembly protein PilN
VPLSARGILPLAGEVSRQAAAPHLFGKRKEQVIARLNLASDPFRNRTLPWTIAVVVSVVSLLALVFILAKYRQVSAEADTSERQVQAMRTERKALEKQAEEVRQTIPPEQFKTLEAAHALVNRKSFSWSQLFSDLEEFLPTSVRVSRINVRAVTQVGDQTRADLDLTVVGREPTDVTGMINEMNRSGTFSAVPLTENHKSGKGESGYEWMLRVSYVQRSRRRGGDAQGGIEGAAAQRPARNNNTSDEGGRE